MSSESNQQPNIIGDPTISTPVQPDGLEQFQSDQAKYKQQDQPLTFTPNAPGIDSGLKLPGEEQQQTTTTTTSSTITTLTSDRPQIEQNHIQSPPLNNNRQVNDRGYNPPNSNRDPFQGGNLIGPDQLHNFDPSYSQQQQNRLQPPGRAPQPRFDPYSPFNDGEPDNDLDMPFNNNMRRPNNGRGPPPGGGFGGPPGGSFGGPRGGFGGPPGGGGGFSGFY